MPRRRPRELRPRPDEASVPPGRTTERRLGRTWVVQEARPVAGAARSFRCPGCDHLVSGGTAHVVAWPETASWPEPGGPDARRHWHRACWQRFG